MSDTIPPVITRSSKEPTNKELIKQLSNDFTELYVVTDDGFSNLDSSLKDTSAILENIYGEIGSVNSNTKNQISSFEDIMNFISDKQTESITENFEDALEEYKSQLAKDKEEQLELYKKYYYTGIDKWNRNITEYIADESKGKDTKEYLQSFMLGPFNALFSPFKKTLEDNGITVAGLFQNFKEKQDEKFNKDVELQEQLLDQKQEELIEEFKRVNDNQINSYNNFLDNNVEEENNDFENNLIESNDEAIEIAKEIDKKLLSEENYRKKWEKIDKKEIEKNDKNNIQEIALLKEINKNIDEGTKEQKKKKGGAEGFLPLLLSALPMLLAAASNIDFKSVFDDIFGGIGEIIGNMVKGVVDSIGKKISEFIETIKKTFEELLGKIGDAVTPDFLKKKTPEQILAEKQEKLKQLENQRIEVENKKVTGTNRLFNFTEEEKQEELAKKDKEILKLKEEISKLSPVNQIKINDGIIYKNGQVIRTSEDDNIFATKNDLRNIGFDNKSIQTQSREVFTDSGREIKELLRQQNQLLIQLNDTIKNKTFNNIVTNATNVETKNNIDLEVFRF